MALYVLKFGGTSLANHERILHVAGIVERIKKEGHDLVVVVSARSGDTNRLIQMAYDISETPDAEEYDALISTGELVSAALLAMQLHALGLDARSYSAHQLSIKTNKYHRKARIETIDIEPLQAALSCGVIPVVTGFQGVTDCARVTTLGRGGSDTTAVNIAAALNADTCFMYTDVDGIYTADPRVVLKASKISALSFDEMLALCSVGSRALHIRSVECAKAHGVALRVLSSFDQCDYKTSGTQIISANENSEKAYVRGIAFDSNQAKLGLLGIKSSPDVIDQITGALSSVGIEMDTMSQCSPGNVLLMDFSFTVHRDDFKEALMIVTDLAKILSAQAVESDDKIAKVSLVGLGIRAHSGAVALMFETLNKEGIVTQLISTSEIKVSFVLDEANVERAVGALHSAFGLNDNVQLTL
jgi:aspartate kinase